MDVHLYGKVNVAFELLKWTFISTVFISTENK